MTQRIFPGEITATYVSPLTAAHVAVTVPSPGVSRSCDTEGIGVTVASTAVLEPALLRVTTDTDYCVLPLRPDTVHVN